MFSTINELCQERGISIYKLSQDTGISQQTLSVLGKRGGNLSSTNLMKIAEYFDKPMEYFFQKENA